VTGREGKMMAGIKVNHGWEEESSSDVLEDFIAFS